MFVLPHTYALSSCPNQCFKLQPNTTISSIGYHYEYFIIQQQLSTVEHNGCLFTSILLGLQQIGTSKGPPAKWGRQQSGAASKVGPPAKWGNYQSGAASKVGQPAKWGRQQSGAASKVGLPTKWGSQKRRSSSKVGPQ